MGRRKPNATDCTPAQTIYTHECWCIIIYHPGDDGDVCPEGEVRYVWNFGFLFIYIYIYICVFIPRDVDPVHTNNNIEIIIYIYMERAIER